MKVKHFELNPFRENTYVLYDETKQCVIIDPGCYDPSEERILSGFIEEQQLNPVALLNTHCHIDHIFGNHFVASRYKLIPQIHPMEKAILASATMVGEMYGLEVTPSPEAETTLADNGIYTFGNTTLKMLLVPGHSPGSICFYHEPSKQIIGGDVLFQESIGRTDLPGGDMQTLLRSIKDKLFVLPDDVTVFPGHGGPTTIGHEKSYNPFLTDASAFTS